MRKTCYYSIESDFIKPIINIVDKTFWDTYQHMDDGLHNDLLKTVNKLLTQHGFAEDDACRYEAPDKSNIETDMRLVIDDAAKLDIELTTNAAFDDFIINCCSDDDGEY